MDVFSKSSGRRAPPAESKEVINTRRLRELRMADEAARREAGTWGDLAVHEITHGPTGAVFVHYWKEPSAPNLSTPKRPRDLSAKEYGAFSDWLHKHPVTEFEHSVVGRNLSKTEAMRVKQSRLSEHHGAERKLINDFQAE